jgi:hypothetical protein
MLFGGPVLTETYPGKDDRDQRHGEQNPRNRKWHGLTILHTPSIVGTPTVCRGRSDSFKKAFEVGGTNSLLYKKRKGGPAIFTKE